MPTNILIAGFMWLWAISARERMSDGPSIEVPSSDFLDRIDLSDANRDSSDCWLSAPNMSFARRGCLDISASIRSKASLVKEDDRATRLIDD